MRTPTLHQLMDRQVVLGDEMRGLIERMGPTELSGWLVAEPPLPVPRKALALEVARRASRIDAGLASHLAPEAEEAREAVVAHPGAEPAAVAEVLLYEATHCSRAEHVQRLLRLVEASLRRGAFFPGRRQGRALVEAVVRLSIWDAERETEALQRYLTAASRTLRAGARGAGELWEATRLLYETRHGGGAGRDSDPAAHLLVQHPRVGAGEVLALFELADTVGLACALGQAATWGGREELLADLVVRRRLRPYLREPEVQVGLALVPHPSDFERVLASFQDEASRDEVLRDPRVPAEAFAWMSREALSRLLGAVGAELRLKVIRGLGTELPSSPETLS